MTMNEKKRAVMTLAVPDDMSLPKFDEVTWKVNYIFSLGQKKISFLNWAELLVLYNETYHDLNIV